MDINNLKVTCFIMSKDYQKELREWFKTHDDPAVRKLWNKFTYESTFICKKDGYLLYYWNDQCFDIDTFPVLFKHIDGKQHDKSFYFASINCDANTKDATVVTFGTLKDTIWNTTVCELTVFDKETRCPIDRHPIISLDVTELTNTCIRNKYKDSQPSTDPTDY